MKKIPFIVLLGLTTGVGFQLGTLTQNSATGGDSAAIALQTQKPVNHIVLFDLKPTVTPEEVEEIAIDSERLLSEIPGVLEVEVGTKARDDRDIHIKDYDLAVYVKLSQNSDLEVYSPHPNHQELLQKHRAKFDKIQVIDFYGE